VTSATSESNRQQLRSDASAFRISQALYVVAKLGIADLSKDGPKMNGGTSFVPRGSIWKT